MMKKKTDRTPKEIIGAFFVKDLEGIMNWVSKETNHYVDRDGLFLQKLLHAIVKTM